MIVSLSETFLTDFSNIRRELLLSATKTEKIEVSENFWENQTDKHEIFINGNFFDVKSIFIIKNKVILNVVNDKLDLNFKKITENLNKKNKVTKNKKNIEILPSKEFQFAFKSSEILSKNNFNLQTILKNKIVIPLFHPPTFI
jgi:hypothetical protein